MVIVWDEVKRRANLEKHGIDFADIGEAFFVSAVLRPAKNGRFSALGFMNGAIFVLGPEGISIISARPASRSERNLMQ